MVLFSQRLNYIFVVLEVLVHAGLAQVHEAFRVYFLLGVFVSASHADIPGHSYFEDVSWAFAAAAHDFMLFESW